MGFTLKNITEEQKKLSETNVNTFSNDKEDILKLQ